MTFRGFKIISLLHENDVTMVYRAVRLKDNMPVVIKALKPTARDERHIAVFANEANILSGLKFEKIVKLITVVAHPSEYLHVFEDIGGRSLYELLSFQKFSIQESLNIALQLVYALDALHQKNIIHADLNPKNIVYNNETKKVQLIDFGHAILRTQSSKQSIDEEESVVNLFYMSPEQTGRIDSTVDDRSDYYSLGMTLYHLFLGRSPFVAKDRYELIHKQIAFSPKPLHQTEAKTPLVLSNIISKLIEKQPNQRYQGLEALTYDIKKCLKLCTKEGSVPDFEIATRDYPVLHMGQLLFGRDKELKVIQKVVKNIGESKRQCVMISGSSGVGKTRLSNELMDSLDSKVRVVRGKFDQYNTLPYLCFKQIFVQIATILISQKDQAFKTKMDAKSIEVLHFMFEELQELFVFSGEKRLHTFGDINQQLIYAVKLFFESITTQEHPLFIYIDDLQWADKASLDLISEVIIASQNENLHLLLSYRDNEGKKYEGVYSFIDQLLSKNSLITHIELQPLGRQHLSELIKSVLLLNTQKAEALTQVVYEKTNGNPFYVKSFIEYMVDKGSLYFDNGEWEYDLNEIQSYQASLNIVSMINEKFSQLNSQEQNYLHYLAVLGGRFDYHLSAEFMQKLGFSQNLFDDAHRHGFIEVHNNIYQFVHDQIHQYIYTLLTPQTLQKIHKEIGSFLEQAYKKGRYNSVTRVVYHLNLAYSAEKMPKKLLELNVLAIEDMLLKNTFTMALELINWVEQHLWDESQWRKQSKLAFKLYMMKAQALYLNTLHEAALHTVHNLIQHAKSLEEKLNCFTLFKNICVTQGKGFTDVRAYGNELLAQMGITVPDRKDVKQALQKLQNEIAATPYFQEPKKILLEADIEGGQSKKILSLLVDYWEVVYYLADIDYMQWSHFTIVDTSFRYGNTTESTFGYVLYGSWLVSQKEYKKAYLFGEVALKLNHRQKDQMMLPKIHNFVANFISPYSKLFESNIALYQQSLHQSKINSDIVFGTWANFLMHLSHYFLGDSLEKLHESMEQESDFLLASGDKKMIGIFKVLQKSVNTLQGEEQEFFDESVVVEMWQQEHFLPGLAWYGIIKAQEAFFYGKIENGLKFLSTYVQNDTGDVIMFSKIRLHFIRALLLLAHKDYLSADEERLLQQDLAEHQGYYKVSPKQFRFHKLLLDAESMKELANPWDVAKKYDAALKEARDRDNAFYMALVGLCAGHFWRELNFLDMSDSYYDTAIVGLNQWGAYGVVPHVKQVRNHNKRDHDLIQSSVTADLSFNKQSIFKAFNAIAKSKSSKDLITVLMQTILENATANKAVLVLEENSEYLLKSTIDFQQGQITFYQLNLDEATQLPLNMISYVLSQGENLILANPAETGNFQFDTYIKEVKPVLCVAIPVKVEGHVSGLLYLENKDLVTTFTQESLETLKLLLTQAAIVFKNTTLYENLLGRERDLNKAQEISHTGSWNFNERTQKLIWSAETYRIFDLEPFSIPICYKWFLEHVHPEDLDDLLLAVESAMKKEKRYDVIHRIVTDKGRIKTVHQRAENFNEVMSGVIQDITTRREAENTARRLSQVVEQNPFPTIITNVDGEIVYANKKTLEMTGYNQEDLSGRSMNIFRSGVHKKKFYTHLWHTIKTEQKVWHGTLINRMQNGETRDCKSVIFPVFDGDGGIINFVTIQEDVTQKNIKDKLFMMQTRQAQMGEMLSMIAHQWRQPLSVISTLTAKQRVNITLKKATPEGSLQAYNDIELQVKHLSQTITDFRDFFKPDKARAQTKNSIIVSKALKLLEHAFNKRDIKVDVTTHNDEPFVTFEHEVEQVILNLLKNAEDVLLEKKVDNPQITIETDTTNKDAVITIQDNGGGIDEDVKDTLFLPYISTKSEQNGTGLGLYMSKTIIEEHCQGVLSAKNIKNGACFTITIPLKVDDE